MFNPIYRQLERFKVAPEPVNIALSVLIGCAVVTTPFVWLYDFANSNGPDLEKKEAGLIKQLWIEDHLELFNYGYMYDRNAELNNENAYIPYGKLPVTGVKEVLLQGMAIRCIGAMNYQRLPEDTAKVLITGTIQLYDPSIDGVIQRSYSFFDMPMPKGLQYGTHTATTIRMDNKGKDSFDGINLYIQSIYDIPDHNKIRNAKLVHSAVNPTQTYFDMPNSANYEGLFGLSTVDKTKPERYDEYTHPFYYDNKCQPQYTQAMTGVDEPHLYSNLVNYKVDTDIDLKHAEAFFDEYTYRSPEWVERKERIKRQKNSFGAALNGAFNSFGNLVSSVSDGLNQKLSQESADKIMSDAEKAEKAEKANKQSNE